MNAQASRGTPTARQSATSPSNGQNNEEARKSAHLTPLFKTRQARIADQMEGIDEVDEEVKAVSEATRC
jgi:hypothetical protein